MMGIGKSQIAATSKKTSIPEPLRESDVRVLCGLQRCCRTMRHIHIPLRLAGVVSPVDTDIVH